MLWMLVCPLISAPIQPYLPAVIFHTISQVIDTINTVLREIIPGMEITLKSLGNEMTETGNLGVRVQLVRTAKLSETGNEIQLPLKYESEGIKKIISILHLFISAYNNPEITLAMVRFHVIYGDILTRDFVKPQKIAATVNEQIKAFRNDILSFNRICH